MLHLISPLEIMKYVSIGLDVLVLLTVLLMLIAGLRKGFLRFFFTNGMKWIMIAVFIIFFSRQVTDLVMGIEIQGTTANAYLVNFIAQQLGKTVAELEGTYLLDLVKALAASVGRVVIILVGTLLISVIVYPIYNLILAIFGVKKAFKERASDGKVTAAGRLVGLLFAVIIAVVKLTVVYGPLYGLITIVSDISDDYVAMQSATAETPTESANHEYEYVLAAEDPGSSTNPMDEYKLYLDEIKKGVVYKLLDNQKFNPSVKYVEYLTTAKTDLGDFSFITEYYNARPLLQFAATLQPTTDPTQVNIDPKDLGQVFDVIKQSGLIKQLIPAGIEMLAMGIVDTPLKDAIDLAEVRTVDWDHEFDLFVKLFDDMKAAAEAMESIEKIGEYLDSDAFGTNIKNIINDIYSFYYVKNYAVDFAQEAIEQAISDSHVPGGDPDPLGEELMNILGYVNLEELLTTDLDDLVKTIVGAARLAYPMSQTEDMMSALFTEKAADNIEEMLTGAFELEIFKNHAVDLISVYLKAAFTDTDIDVDSMPLDTIEWSTEPAKFSAIFKEIIHLCEDEETIDSETIQRVLTTKDVTTLATKCVESDLVKKILIYAADDAIKKALTDNGFAEIADDVQFKTLSEEDLKHDVVILVRIFTQVQSASGESELDVAKIAKNSIVDFFDLKVIQGKEEKIFNFIIQSNGIDTQLTEIGITIDTTDVDWHQEAVTISKLFDVDLSMISSMSNINSENAEEVKTMLKLVLDLQTMNKSVPNMIYKVFSESSMGDWTSVWLNDQRTTFVRSEWDEEVDNIVDAIVALSNDSIEDFSNFSQLSSHRETLKAFAKVKSISFDHLALVVNEQIQALTQTQEFGTNYVETTGINWEDELDLLLADNSPFIELATASGISTGQFTMVGKALDQLRSSQMFGPHLNELLRDLIKTTPAYKTLENPTGIFEDADLTDAKLNSVASWENELKVLDEIDLSSNTQTGDVLDKIAYTTLISSKISEYAYTVIDNCNLGEYYSQLQLASDIEVINQKVREENYSWSTELQAIELFQDALNHLLTDGYDEETLTNNRNALIAVAESAVITSRMLEKVQVKYPILFS